MSEYTQHIAYEEARKITADYNAKALNLLEEVRKLPEENPLTLTVELGCSWTQETNVHNFTVHHAELEQTLRNFTGDILMGRADYLSIRVEHGG